MLGGCGVELGSGKCGATEGGKVKVKRIPLPSHNLVSFIWQKDSHRDRNKNDFCVFYRRRSTSTSNIGIHDVESHDEAHRNNNGPKKIQANRQRVTYIA